jgi:hypothetical protein
VWSLAFLKTARRSSLFDATLLQFLTHKILMSCHTHSSHLSLGLPTFLLPSGLVLKIVLIILFSLVRIKCPAHSNLFTFMNLKISGSLYDLDNGQVSEAYDSTGLTSALFIIILVLLGIN